MVLHHIWVCSWSLCFFCDSRAHLQAWNIAREWFNTIASYLGNPAFNFGSSVPVLKFFWLLLPHPSRFILYWRPIRFTVTSAVETPTSSKLRHHTRTRWNLYVYCSCLFQNKAIGGSGIWPRADSRGPQLCRDRSWFALAMASRSAGAEGKLRWLNTVTSVCEPGAVSIW